MKTIIYLSLSTLLITSCAHHSNTNRVVASSNNLKFEVKSGNFGAKLVIPDFEFTVNKHGRDQRPVSVVAKIKCSKVIAFKLPAGSTEPCNLDNKPVVEALSENTFRVIGDTYTYGALGGGVSLNFELLVDGQNVYSVGSDYSYNLSPLEKFKQPISISTISEVKGATVKARININGKTNFFSNIEKYGKKRVSGVCAIASPGKTLTDEEVKRECFLYGRSGIHFRLQESGHDNEIAISSSQMSYAGKEDATKWYVYVIASAHVPDVQIYSSPLVLIYDSVENIDLKSDLNDKVFDFEYEI